MRYEDRKLLEQWARLQLSIAISITARDGHKLEHNVGRVDRVDSDNLFKSIGWRALRTWWMTLSRFAKRNASGWMKKQLQGVRAIQRKIEAAGGTFNPATDLAEIDFNIRIRTPDGGEVEPLSFGDLADDQPVAEEQDNDDSTDNATQAHPKARNAPDEARGGGEDRKDPGALPDGGA